MASNRIPDGLSYDLGIENLYDPFHGNVNIVFNDDTKIKVDSRLLSLNSTTFCYFFNTLLLKNVEIKDFTKEAVILYLESLYTGELNLEKGLFRELNKLSFVFKTKWISDRCTEFFDQLCKNISTVFEDLCFVFNEALYADNILKNEAFMKIVVARFSEIENIASIFVERYLTENGSSMTSETLDDMLLICAEDLLPVLKSSKQRLVDEGIDDTVRSLLANPKIVECLADNQVVYGELYELLAVKSDSMTDLRLLTNLNVCVIKASRGLSKTPSKPVNDIPNLFHDWGVFRGLSEEDILGKLSSMPNMSIFMFVELHCLLEVRCILLRERLKEYTDQKCANKSLCRPPTIFFKDCIPAYLPFFPFPESVISEDDTVTIVSTETALLQLTTLTASKLYRFYFQHPAAPKCKKDTECGFLVRVTLCSKKEAGRFDIQLVTEESQYPPNIHCHSEVISGADMHFVVEGNWCGKWCNLHVTWRNQVMHHPEKTDDPFNLRWPEDSRNLRFVVYYDIRDKSR